MPVYLVVSDNTFSLDKIKRSYPADYIQIFSNSFLINYEFEAWRLRDEIGNLVYEENPNFEIVITVVEKTDLALLKNVDIYVNYIFNRSKSK